MKLDGKAYRGLRHNPTLIFIKTHLFYSIVPRSKAEAFIHKIPINYMDDTPYLKGMIHYE